MPRLREHPRISVDPAICGGKPCVAGTRMRVRDVLGGLAAGDTEADLLDSFPFLTMDDIRACLAYGAEVSSRPPFFVAQAAE